ncbi:MAG: hypothetical protein M3Y51_09915 [Actinomycetota bacterium]|nr:hypothetical protein [Actinomycetota bacterium]
MTSDHSAPDGDISRALDRLGDDAVAESGPPPPVSRRPWGPSSRPATWLAAAAIVLLVGVGATVLASTGGDDTDRVHADRTADPTEDPQPVVTVPAPVEAQRADVNVVFRPDPDRPTSFIGSVTNDDTRPWSWDCTVGDLFRWDGSTWVLVADAAIWNDDGELRLFEHEVGLDCGPPARYLGPGVTEDRAMSPEWDLTGTSTRPLDEPGDYRLVVPDGTGRFAVGRFRIGGDAEAAPDPASELPPPPDDPSCTLLTSTELREVTGVDPEDSTGPVHMTPQPCWVGDTEGEASYRIAPLDEARLAFEDPNVDDLGPPTVEGADESRVARFRGSGRTGERVMGSVIVGDRAVVFSLGGAHSRDDDTAVRLATALAAELRG